MDSQLCLKTLQSAPGIVPARRGIADPPADGRLQTRHGSHERFVGRFEHAEAGRGRLFKRRSQILRRQIDQFHGSVHHVSLIPTLLPPLPLLPAANVSETSARLVADASGW